MGRQYAFGSFGRRALGWTLGVVVLGAMMGAVTGDGPLDPVKDDRQEGMDPMGAYNPFWSALVRSVLMIMATEIADKTFFIAAIMAMTHARIVVFGGAVGALAVMTLLSAAVGSTLPTFLPMAYTHFASALLFLYFGLRMLKEGMESRGGPSEELAEVEEELTRRHECAAKKGGAEGSDVEEGTAQNGTDRAAGKKGAAEIVVAAFTMTFLAEWGDRSQIATIAMATKEDMWGVTAGGIIGHAVCTGMAVIGGRMLATRISERTVHLVGGVLFVLFGLHALVFSN